MTVVVALEPFAKTPLAAIDASVSRDTPDTEILASRPVDQDSLAMETDVLVSHIDDVCNVHDCPRHCATKNGGCAPEAICKNTVPRYLYDHRRNNLSR